MTNIEKPVLSKSLQKDVKQFVNETTNPDRKQKQQDKNKK